MALSIRFCTIPKGGSLVDSVSIEITLLILHINPMQKCSSVRFFRMQAANWYDCQCIPGMKTLIPSSYLFTVCEVAKPSASSVV